MGAHHPAHDRDVPGADVHPPDRPVAVPDLLPAVHLLLERDDERIGRRWALIIPLTIAMFLVPMYIHQTDRSQFLIFFLLFICFFGGKDALNPGWLAGRFPTEEIGR